MTLLLTAIFKLHDVEHVVLREPSSPDSASELAGRENYLSGRRNCIAKRTTLFHGRPEYWDALRQFWKRDIRER